jgi:general secretion pathway protein A
MQKKLQGNKVAIFIDDAQRLNRDVLEQVRLISNLETTRDKLLQIILIGEPILTQMLTSHALRQIGQRVSVGYYIDAFTYDETMAYIQHRLTIASKGSSVRFDPKAVRRIFRYSGGIPRTINIACERALKVAFYRKEKLITGDIAEEAIRYLAGRSEMAFSSSRRRKMLGWLSAVCCLLLAISVIAVFIRHSSIETPSEQIKTEKSPIITTPAPASVPEITPDAHRETGISVIEKNKPAKPGPIVAPVLPAKSPATTNEDSSVAPMPSPRMTHSVQVGAFREGEYAKQLVDELTAKGYSARIVPVSDSRQRTWLTVRIGDYPTHEAAKAEADAFSARENMQTAVRPFGKL